MATSSTSMPYTSGKRKSSSYDGHSGRLRRSARIAAAAGIPMSASPPSSDSTKPSGHPDLNPTQAVANSADEESSVPQTEEEKKAHREAEAQALRASKVFGHIEAIPNGTWLPSRKDFAIANVHRQPVAGIFGRKEGAYSVVVSGGDDDVDNGDSFTFTGEGGSLLHRSFETRKAEKQQADQQMNRGNLALKKSFETQNPVRVIRGYRGRTVWAPKAGFRYDGQLYKVTTWWDDRAQTGFRVFKFLFDRIPGQPPIDIAAGPGSYTAEQAQRYQEYLERRRDRQIRSAVNEGPLPSGGENENREDEASDPLPAEEQSDIVYDLMGTAEDDIEARLWHAMLMEASDAVSASYMIDPALQSVGAGPRIDNEAWRGQDQADKGDTM
ncbi:MAG: hypothetical protein M1817_001820 [Caeruleum heppii]|nr:MAG: hypothetical protein M1817_001820 [Caeruleum heppii]